MLEQTQNPFVDSNHNHNFLFASILTLSLITIGIISIVNLQKKTNEDI
jgi:hypothetical protein